MLRQLRQLQCTNLCRAWAHHRPQAPITTRHIATCALPRTGHSPHHLPTSLRPAQPHWLPPASPTTTRPPTPSHHQHCFQRLLCHAKNKKSSSSKPPKNQPKPTTTDDTVLLGEDGLPFDFEFDQDFDPEFEQLDEDDLDNDEDPFGDNYADQISGPDDSSPTISLGQASWGEPALEACRAALQAPGMEDLDLYAFRVITPRQRIDIRLDNLEDYYGSPTLDQVAGFSRVFYERLVAAVGETLAGEIDVEVSSPGAEREIRVPADLARFEELPMKVQYVTEEGTTEVKVVALEAVGEAVSTWRLADVKANSPGKGRKLSKKQREVVFEIPLERIRKVNLHIDY